MGALRGIHSFIQKKEQMLATVVRMKGKVEFALQMRSQKRVVQKEALDLASMKPLLKINGGIFEETNGTDGKQQDEGEDEGIEEEEGEIDDELDDEDDQDDKLYQEAYENEEIDEPIEEGGEEFEEGEDEA